MLKVARLEEEFDKFTIFESDNMVEKLGEFSCLKRQLEEFGTMVSNPIHNLLGKLPSSCDSFKDNIYLCVPFPSYEDAMGLLHDRCLSPKATKHFSKNDLAFLGQVKEKPKAKGKGNNKVKKASSEEVSKRGTHPLKTTSNPNALFVVVSVIRRSNVMPR